MTTEDLVQDYRRIVAGQVKFPTESMRPGPITYEKTQPRRVWLLWRNDQVLGVLGSYDRAWEELHELMAEMGGVWHPSKGHMRWVNFTQPGCRLEIEPREVVG